MARRKKQNGTREMEGAGEFAGPDITQEAQEKIDQAEAAAQHDKRASNGDTSLRDEEAWKRAALQSIAEDLEIEKHQGAIAESRGRLSSIRKVAKSQGVDWAVIVLHRKDARRIRNGEMGAMVTEERSRRWLMKVTGSPLATQFDLWEYAEAAGSTVSSEKPGFDAELQGQHAYSNNEPLTNNPFQPGKPEHVDWAHGWKQAQTANARSMGPG